MNAFNLVKIFRATATLRLFSGPGVLGRSPQSSRGVWGAGAPQGGGLGGGGSPPPAFRLRRRTRCDDGTERTKNFSKIINYFSYSGGVY